MKRLVLDIGNTRCKYGVFDENDFIIDYHVSEDLDVVLIDHLCSGHAVSTIGLASTRNLELSTIHQISQKYHLVYIDDSVKVPIKNLYRTPETLGRDRLAAVVGANHKYAGENCICISAGTCITYDFIDHEGVYHGGNIAPGLQMRLEAMHAFTDKLPLVEAMYNEDVLGKSTDEALQNGAVRGAIFELESFIQLMIEKFGPVRVLISGGDSNFFADRTKYQIFAHSNLILEGLNEIMKFNGY